MVALRSKGKVLAIFAMSLGLAVVTCLLPENPYQRWQLLDGTIHARSRWIYERIHFDPTPIDVAVVGPSRLGAGVNAPRLGAALVAMGLPGNTANFSLPETGRNINYVVVSELLEAKQPKLLVIGVIEKPSRFGHSAFKYIAPRSMIATPAYLGEINYLPDLLFLPFRQLRLFAANIAPGWFGLTKQFDPARFRGHSIDTTGNVILPDGSIKNGEEAASLAELQRGVQKLERGNHPPILSARFADLEFGDERHYIRAITALAKVRGVRVAFVALPYFSGSAAVQENELYRRYGPVWNAAFLSPHAELYGDYGHVTKHGSDIVTDWLAGRVAVEMRKSK
jgi:hypothetical protein